MPLQTWPEVYDAVVRNRVPLPPAVLIALSLAFVTASARPAAAKTYSAERYDAVVRVLPGGVLDVTETVVFRFEDGTFRRVFREIPIRRTDGVEIVGAEMQGEALPRGDEPGTVEIEERSREVRVTWHFTPVEDVTRRFTLHYRVRGAVRRQEGRDVLVWRPLPGEHDYAIARSAVRFELPQPPLDVAVNSRRTGTPAVRREGESIVVEAGPLRKNGWVDVSLAFPEGTIIPAPPAWQAHAAEVRRFAPAWALAAGGLFLAALIVLTAWRQSYEAPPGDGPSRLASSQPLPPDDLPPAIAGALAANGSPGLVHALGTLFALADRGTIAIRALPASRFRQPEFELTRRAGGRPHAPYEQAVLDAVYKGAGRGSTETVTLSKARSRLTSGLRPFSTAVREELAAVGLLDAGRGALRTRYHRTGVVLCVAGGLLLLPLIAIADDFGAWALLVAGAVLAAGLAAFVFASTITPLSNEGVRRAARWRSFGAHLRGVARERTSAAGVPVSSVLPYAVALGLAAAWAKFLKRHHHPAPAWFQASAAGEEFAAFPALLTHGGDGGGAGGGGGGSGAAGGGASGAG